MTTNGKPRKKDFTDMREFMKAAAAWAEANNGEWPWGGPKDEDDEYCFVAAPAPKPPVYTLDELLAGMTEKNLHGKVDFGPAVGEEFPNNETADDGADAALVPRC